MLCHNTIQTIQLHILFQWDQNYFLQSNILFTQYILTPVHPLNTTYDNNLFKHTLGGFMSTYPFYSSMAISPCPNYSTTQLYLHQHYYVNGIKIISFSQIYFSLNIFEHQSSTKHNLWNNLFKHTLGGFMGHFPLCKMLCHNNSNYSPKHIISMGSKLFPSVKYTFHSIYSNTSPSTKYKLW